LAPSFANICYQDSVVIFLI